MCGWHPPCCPFLLPFLPFTVYICVCIFVSPGSPILSHSSSFYALPSEFSEVVDLFTSCSVPLPPLPPELVRAGVTWLCLQWQRPTGSPKEDDIYYVLEMEEEGSVCLLRHLFFQFFSLMHFRGTIKCWISNCKSKNSHYLLKWFIHTEGPARFLLIKELTHLLKGINRIVIFDARRCL